MASVRKSFRLLWLLFGASSAHPTNPDNWLSECFQTFQANYVGSGTHINYSNFDLIDKPSGLCADHLSCAWEKCTAPDSSKDIFSMNLTGKTYDDVKSFIGPLNLPAEMVFPERAADIVQAIGRAKAERLTVSVKATGHSYTGSSTSKGSIGLNLRRLKKYSSSSVLECANVPLEDENSPACRLAADRGKNAIVKIGGGETWDEVYRAVMQANTSARYTVVGGGAGSVGAAGGWLQGGGLSFGAERMYGLGVDQVLEIEMVLPDERHVRFGPVKWEPVEGYIYPRTVAVGGMCNPNVHEKESDWSWKACEEPIPPFDELWFAVRGGGGGTYGVVTAVKVQLHDAMPFHAVLPNPNAGAWLAALTPALKDKVSRLHVFFLLDFLYNPSRLNVDAAASTRCGSPALDFRPGATLLFCHDNAFEILTASWSALIDRYADSDPAVAAVAYQLKQLFTFIPFGSYPELALAIAPSACPATPKGRVPDSPPPALLPDKGLGGWCSAQLPKSWLADGNDDVYQVLSQRGGEHTTGGNVGIAHDQMTSVPKTERQSGLSSTSLHGLDQELQERLLASFLQDTIAKGASFPGVSEFNHICPDSFGPLRSDMSKPCPLNYTVAQKEAECFSIQESIWGTETLAKLENIKFKLDPENLFDCYTCVKPSKVKSPSQTALLI